MISEYQAIVQNGFCTNTPVQSLQRIWDVLPSLSEKRLSPSSLPVSSPTLLKINTKLPEKQRLTVAARTEASLHAWSQSH